MYSSVSAIMVLLALTFLTPYFSYIPKATLAAVIICAVLFMVEVTITKLIWNIHSKLHVCIIITKYTRLFLELDIVPFLITFVACLALGIEVGILIGVVIDVLLLLYYNARPKLIIETISVSIHDTKAHKQTATKYIVSWNCPWNYIMGS